MINFKEKFAKSRGRGSVPLEKIVKNGRIYDPPNSFYSTLTGFNNSAFRIPNSELSSVVFR